MTSVSCITTNHLSVKTASLMLSKPEEKNNNSDVFQDKNAKSTLGPYDLDIYNHLRATEARHRPSRGYMIRQPFVEDSMRSSLVEWLVSVVKAKNFPTSTLYLAVAYVDRILSLHSVKLEEFQLMGLVALIIAAKVDHEYNTDLYNYLFHMDFIYSKNHVRRVERLLLGALNFELLVPTAYEFLTYYCADLTDDVRFLSMYICELTLLESDPYSHFLPSFLAAAVVALAQHTLEKQVWPKELEAKSGYGLLDLQYIFFFLEQTFKNPPDNYLRRGIQRKYESEEFLKVSLVKPREGYSYVRCW